MKIFFSEVIKLFKRSFSALKTVNTYLALTALTFTIKKLIISIFPRLQTNLLKETRQENTYLASSNKTKLKF